MSPCNSSAMQVVPIPCKSGLAREVRNTAAHAPSMASRSASASGVSGSGAADANGSSVRMRAAISSRSTVCTASLLAVSPPAWPPIPSHTTYSPMSSLTSQLSSLCSRFIPVSVRAALWNLLRGFSLTCASIANLHLTPPCACDRRAATGPFRAARAHAPARPASYDPKEAAPARARAPRRRSVRRGCASGREPPLSRRAGVALRTLRSAAGA